MSFFDFFRKFFVGSNESVPNQSDSGFRNDFRNPIWDNNDDDSDNDFRSRGFSIYTDPLEIHRFFEQQMNEMLKSFHMFEPFQDFDSFFGSGFHDLPGIDQSPFGFNQPPAIDAPPNDSSQSLRDQLLKPEYRRIESPSDKVDDVLDGQIEPSPFGFKQPPASEAPPNDSSQSLREQILKPEYRRIESPSDKVDDVLDGQIYAHDIGKALEQKDSSVPIWSPNSEDRALIPRRDGLIPKGNFFSFSGRSRVSRIVRRPDGTVEREEIVKESDGTETKTVTRRSGDHEYSVTTITDPSGAEKCTETFKKFRN